MRRRRFGVLAEFESGQRIVGAEPGGGYWEHGRTLVPSPVNTRAYRRGFSLSGGERLLARCGGFGGPGTGRTCRCRLLGPVAVVVAVPASVTPGRLADPAVLGVSDLCRCMAGHAGHVSRARYVAVVHPAAAGAGAGQDPAALGSAGT